MDRYVAVSLIVRRPFTACGRVHRKGEFLTVKAQTASALIKRGACRLASRAECDGEWKRIHDEGRSNALYGYAVS